MILEWFNDLFDGCSHKWETYERMTIIGSNSGNHLYTIIRQQCKICGKEKSYKID